MFDTTDPTRFIGPFGPDSPPTRISDMFWLAASDIARMPESIRLDMSIWLAEGEKHDDICYACAAGAVALGHAGVRSRSDLQAIFNAKGGWNDVLKTIDSARHGLVQFRYRTDDYVNVAVDMRPLMGAQVRDDVIHVYRALAQALDETVYKDGVEDLSEETRDDFRAQAEAYLSGKAPLPPVRVAILEACAA